VTVSWPDYIATGRAMICFAPTRATSQCRARGILASRADLSAKGIPTIQLGIRSCYRGKGELGQFER
jgi:hypothetical protein